MHFNRADENCVMENRKKNVGSGPRICWTGIWSRYWSRPDPGPGPPSGPVDREYPKADNLWTCG